MEIDLEVISPVHIGSGDDIYGQELVFDSGRAWVPDITEYFEKNPHRVDEFMETVEKGKSLHSFFDNIHENSRYSMDLWAEEGGLNHSDISAQIKDGFDNPYLPGTSIKGCIRTALAHRALTQGGENLSRVTGDEIEKIFRLGKNDPKHDLMKAISVRDAQIKNNSDPEDPLVLPEVKTYSMKDIDMEPKKHWSDYVESIAPGTEFTTQIKVDASLVKKMIDKFGYRRKAERVLGDEISREGILHTIRDALQGFAEDVKDEDVMLLSEPKFDDIRDLYGSMNFQKESYFRIGFGTSWYSNTVGTALSGEEKKEARAEGKLGYMTHKGCGGNLDNDDYNQGKLFCHSCKTGGIDPISDEVSMMMFPKTRRLVKHRGKPEFPLGWVKAEF